MSDKRKRSKAWWPMLNHTHQGAWGGDGLRGSPEFSPELLQTRSTVLIGLEERLQANLTTGKGGFTLNELRSEDAVIHCGISFSLLSDTTTPEAVKAVTLWLAPPI